MQSELYVILDDRDLPPASVIAAIGNVRFGEIIHRRRTLIEALKAVLTAADDVVVLKNDADIATLATRLASVDAQSRWLHLPLALPPVEINKLDALLLKARFARTSMIVGTTFNDDAPMVLTAPDAAAFLAIDNIDGRRRWVRKLAAQSPPMHAEGMFVDLREPRTLTQYLSGATEPRAFNALIFKFGVVGKRSSNRDKMKAEHDFFHLAHAESKRFLVPTFGYFENASEAGYEMARIDVPDAALQLIHNAFTEEEFSRLLDSLIAYLEARERSAPDRNAVVQSGRELFIEKLNSRIDDVLSTSEGQRLERLLEVSCPLGGLRQLVARIIPRLECLLESDRFERLVFSHGDSCLSNVLFDRRLGWMSLVDPRGAIQHGDAMLHPLYDVAKISQSVLGGYDFVNSERFSVIVDEELGLDLALMGGGTPNWARAAFVARLEASGWSVDDVRAVECSLFLSLMALHTDHPRKLVGYALSAAEIINTLES